MQTVRYINRTIAYVILIGASVIALFPIYWLFLSAVKPAKEMWSIPPTFIFEPDFSYFSSVIREKGILKYLANSLMISSGSTCISLFLGSLAAYALTRYPIKGGGNTYPFG